MPIETHGQVVSCNCHCDLEDGVEKQRPPCSFISEIAPDQQEEEEEGGGGDAEAAVEAEPVAPIFPPLPAPPPVSRLSAGDMQVANGVGLDAAAVAALEVLAEHDSVAKSRTSIMPKSDE